MALHFTFLSGLIKISTSLNGKKQDAWKPKQVYHYIQWKNIEPHFVVDVTGFIETKIRAVKAYKSQFYDPNSNEPSSPISSKNFMDSITYRAQDLGRLIGTGYGEGFTADRFVAVKSFDNLI